MAGKRSGQQGFSLPEVLIAAAIAAGVVAAAAQAISFAVRLSAAATRSETRLVAAKTIVSRVKAGMDDADALEGFKHWRLSREPAPRFAEAETPSFDQVTLRHEEDANWTVGFWALRLREPAS